MRWVSFYIAYIAALIAISASLVLGQDVNESLATEHVRIAREMVSKVSSYKYHLVLHEYVGQTDLSKDVERAVSHLISQVGTAPVLVDQVLKVFEAKGFVGQKVFDVIRSPEFSQCVGGLEGFGKGSAIVLNDVNVTIAPHDGFRQVEFLPSTETYNFEMWDLEQLMVLPTRVLANSIVSSSVDEDRVLITTRTVGGQTTTLEYDKNYRLEGFTTTLSGRPLFRQWNLDHRQYGHISIPALIVRTLWRGDGGTTIRIMQINDVKVNERVEPLETIALVEGPLTVVDRRYKTPLITDLHDKGKWDVRALIDVVGRKVNDKEVEDTEHGRKSSVAKIEVVPVGGRSEVVTLGLATLTVLLVAIGLSIVLQRRASRHRTVGQPPRE